MSNSVNLSLDVTKTGIQNPLIKVRQGDGGFETLHTTVTSNGEPMDLQGWTITFMGTTAGNHKIVDGNVTLVEAPNGIFDYTPSKAWGMDIGEFEIAYFKFVKGDGSASSANFRVNVIEAVDLTQEEAQNYISVVDTTIAEINQHLTNSLANVTQSIAEANANANTVASNVTALGNRVDEYNNKLTAIKVGGRNLFKDSKGLSHSLVQNGATVTVEPFDSTTNMWHIVAPASDAWAAGFYMPGYGNEAGLKDGDNWAFSADMKGIGEINILGMEGGTHTPQPVGNITSDWKRVSQTGVVGGSNSLVIFLHTTPSQGVDAYVKLPKLEHGNIPTDWTPAPEDAPSNDAQLVHKTGNETIAGDKTVTGKLSVTNLNVSGDTPNTVLTYNSGFSGGASYYYVKNKVVHLFIINVKGFTASGQRAFEIPNSIKTTIPGTTYFSGIYGIGNALVGFNGTQVYISTSAVSYDAGTMLNAYLTWGLS